MAEISPRNPTRAKKIYKYIGALMLILYAACAAFSFNYQSEPFMSKRTIQSFIFLNTEPDNLIVSNQPEKPTFFIVKKDVDMRLKPIVESPAITVLHGKQKVKFIKKHKDWIKIQHYNVEDDCFESGWCRAKYLGRIH